MINTDSIKKHVGNFSLLIFFFISIIYLELVIKFSFEGFIFDLNTIYMILFSAVISLFLFFLASFFKIKVNKIIAITTFSIITLFFMIQMVFRTIFGIYLTVFAAVNGTAALQFGSIIGGGIQDSLVQLILMILPLLLLIFLGLKKWFPRDGDWKFALLVGAFVIFGHIACLIVLPFGGNAYGTPYSVYFDTVNMNISASDLGLITTTRIDIKRNIFGFKEKITPIDETALVVDETIDKDAESEVVQVVYEHNIMDIDFEALKASTDNQDLIDVHNYFSTQEPTLQNEKTGIYKDYNLIMIIAESFSPYAIHPEKTPTLYKMVNDGYNFTNFYNCYWEGSTIAGEYGANFGLLPINDDGFQSISKMRYNNSYFTMGWQFRRLGYPAVAFHANTYTYYHREQIHPSMGYDFYAKGNGLDLPNPNAWPQSDVETVEASLPFYLDGTQPFHAYYMSISGHCNYTFDGNMMSRKHQEAVADMPLSDEAKAYIACNMEFDKSLELLMQKLEEAGVAENTLIMITPDHYPYEMSESAYDELAGHPIDRNLELFKSTLILYTKGMTPEKIDIPCSAADILPTLSNMMGMEYDSRLMSGRDIFSTAEHIVALKGRSWVTDKAFYNGRTQEVTPVNNATIEDGYVDRINNIVASRFWGASKILEYDYYNILFGG